jgi:MFS family permease
MPPAASPTFRSLRHRNARWYFGGLVVSTAGTWLQGTAQAWLVLRLSDSGAALGGVVAAQFVPMLLLGAWAGALADRVDKRRLMFAMQAIAGVQAVVLGVLDLTDVVTLPMVFVMSAVLGVVNAIDSPSRRSLIAELVEPDELTNAMALNTAVMTGSRIIGPAVAGFLIEGVGTGWCFILNGVTFVAVLAALVAMDPTQMRPARKVVRAKGQVREGLAFVWRHPVLAPTFAALVAVSIFTFNYQVTIPLLVERVFDGNAATFGALLAVTSVGSLLGSLTAARRPAATTAFMLAAIAVLGVSMVALALSPTLALAFLASVPMGAGGAAFMATTSGMLLHLTAPEMRGRILALQAMAFLGATPVGSPLAGAVAEAWGARAALVAGGVAALICAAGVGLALRRSTAVGAVPAGVEPSVLAD